MIETTYNDVKITLAEDSEADKWVFQLRGRTRTAPSLFKAREAIDKAPKVEKEPFHEFEAILGNYEGYHLVTVTSYAGRNQNSYASFEHEFWVLGSKGKRHKVPHHELFQASQHNRNVIADMAVLEEEIKERQKGIQRLAKDLHIIPTSDPNVEWEELTERQQETVAQAKREVERRHTGGLRL